MYKGDTPLVITTNGSSLEVRNYTKRDETESKYICKLNDFFMNNIEFELGKISVLQLESCDISEIPYSICQLNLKQLLLPSNKLREVPSCLYSGLKTLKVLDLSHNFIKNFDIEPACSCTITTLKINDNKIYNFPHWVLTLRCPELVEVVYNNNFITSLKPSHELNIKKLEMCNCQLRDIDFQFFKGIKTLEHLDIGNNKQICRNDNQFKDIDQIFVNVKWQHLKILKLNHLTISIPPQGIFWIVSLTELYLINCDLSWIPENVQYLSNLQILDVSLNSICSLPHQLTLLENLRIVKAPFNSISKIAEFKNSLEILDLYSNHLESFPDHLDAVQFLDLEQNFFDTTQHGTYQEYKRKRDEFRELFVFVRNDGPTELPDDSVFMNNSSKSSSSSSEDWEHDYKAEYFDIHLENWDEEVKPKPCAERHPEITTSDDEWDGKEDIRRKGKLRSIKMYNDANEDWIFCDVENELS